MGGCADVGGVDGGWADGACHAWHTPLQERIDPRRKTVKGLPRGCLETHPYICFIKRRIRELEEDNLRKEL
jgi:hypothetical protein